MAPFFDTFLSDSFCLIPSFFSSVFLASFYLMLSFLTLFSEPLIFLFDSCLLNTFFLTPFFLLTFHLMYLYLFILWSVTEVFLRYEALSSKVFIWPWDLRMSLYVHVTVHMSSITSSARKADRHSDFRTALPLLALLTASQNCSVNMKWAKGTSSLSPAGTKRTSCGCKSDLNCSFCDKRQPKLST